MLNINPYSSKLAIGLMSGTSADGIDAALVQISGCGTSLKVSLKHFVTMDISTELRDRMLLIAKGDFGGSQELCLFNMYFGQLLADACTLVCKQANVSEKDIAFVGSHGQTLFHQPHPTEYLDGKSIAATLQLGEASCIAERMGCPVVSDFRVRDMAAGGQGAPLVPYSEFLIYRSTTKAVALQNIGGIGNITLLPANCSLQQIIAFDTGPGNMVMDAITYKITNGKQRYDTGGLLAINGKVSQLLLTQLLQDPYIALSPPKTTGREYFGEYYVAKLWSNGKRLNLNGEDILATATCFTAKTIAVSVNNYCKPKPQQLIVGGGGSLNPVLMQYLKDSLPECQVVTNEEIGLDSNAKEAIAFAVLANETLCGLPNNVPTATGAKCPVIMGKISL